MSERCGYLAHIVEPLSCVAISLSFVGHAFGPLALVFHVSILPALVRRHSSSSFVSDACNSARVVGMGVLG